MNSPSSLVTFAIPLFSVTCNSKPDNAKSDTWRVFDNDTGNILCKYELPVAGYATSAVYEAGRIQFVVIACGGGKSETGSGNRYLAFTLCNHK
jgi:glucose dehydrogenase